ncbi:hypothetical protein [Ralstonia syzygii]|nr:hypothetical protein [Ralstonia syzygii]
MGRAAEVSRGYLEQAHPNLVEQSGHLHPHAYRHAFGMTSAETDVPVDVA